MVFVETEKVNDDSKVRLGSIRSLFVFLKRGYDKEIEKGSRLKGKGVLEF